MNAISKELELPGAFVIGAGAVASKVVGVNAEVNHIYSITPQILSDVPVQIVLKSF